MTPAILNGRLLGILLLVLAVSFSPRISLPLDIPGRVFDVRAEDLLLVFLLGGWFCGAMLRPRIYRTPLFLPVGLYLAIMVLTTLFNAIDRPGNFPRNLFYVLKDVEYFLLFFLVANWVRTRVEMEAVFKAFLIAGGLNVCWVLVQILFEFKSPLFGLGTSASLIPGQDNRQVIYTASLIGEFSMFSASLYFSFLSFLAYGAYLFRPFAGRLARNLLLAFGFLLTASSILVGVKISLILFILGVSVLSVLRGRVVLLLWAVPLVALVTAVITATIHLFGDGQSIAGFPIHRVIDWKSYRIGGDRLEAWGMILPQLLDTVLLGVGKGGTVVMNGIETWYEESHNHYIKLVLESGIYGLLAFLFLLWRIGLLAVHVFRRASTATARIFSSATLCALLGLCAAAVVQDAFKPVLPNEMFWIFAGMTAAAYRMNPSEDGASPMTAAPA